MRRELLALLALAFCISTQTQAQAPIKTGSAAEREAQKKGLPKKIGDWQLVRHVLGEQGHFLYANQKRTFSLFVTETQNHHPLQPQQGWKAVDLGAGLSGFLHTDPRNPERTALAFKHQTTRRMILGKLTEAELIRLAKLLR